jgi:deoxyribodipyrimidine photolyase
MHALKEGNLSCLPNGKSEIIKEAQKEFHEFIKDLQEPLLKGHEEKSAKKIPDAARHLSEPLRSPLQKPDTNTLAQMKFLPTADPQNTSEKGVIQKMATFLASQQAAFVKPQNSPQTPQSITVPYQEFSISESRRLLRTRKKEDKTGKREERPLSYSSDEEEDEEHNK